MIPKTNIAARSEGVHMECRNGGGYDHRKSFSVPLGATVDMCQILPEVNRVLRGGMGMRGGACVYLYSAIHIFYQI
jgi:hypothetical protein